MEIDSLEELKKYYPKGYHKPDFFNSENALESNVLVNRANEVHGVNTNHGWKLHADLKTELTIEEAYGKLGLKLNDPENIRAGWTVADQDVFDNFQKRLRSLGVNFAELGDKEQQTYLSRFMLKNTRKEMGSVNVGTFETRFADPNDTLRMAEILGENDIGYKTSAAYHQGRQFTFYAQSIEERDRIIGIIEGSDIADRLEDADDPNFRKTIQGPKEEKNAPISKKTSGRFTTDYLDVNYVDDNGRPLLNLAHDSQNQPAKERPGLRRATQEQVEQNEKLLITGKLDAQDVEAIDQTKKLFPEMDELLRGKPGYVTPYATIEDMMEWRKIHGVMGYEPGTGIPGLTPIKLDDSLRRAPKPVNPTVTTGPTPGSIPSGPTVTTGETPGSVPSRPTVTTGPTPGSVPSGPTVTTGETPGRKPVGRPVTTANTPSPPPTATQARETAEKVTKSGNATPPPKATIQSTAPVPPRPSSGAPVKSPGRLRTAADDLSAAVTQGPNGARNLKMLGIAGALGVAGFALSRGRGSAQDENETRRRLEMQRRGIM